MAITIPSILSAISGKLAGLEFALTKNGHVVKHARCGRPLSSPRCMRALHDMAVHNALWRDLTDDEIQAWTAATATYPAHNRLGKPIQLSPHMLFNICVIDVDAFAPSTAPRLPPTYTPMSPQEMTATFTAGGPYTIFRQLPTPFPVNWWDQLYVARWQSRSTTHTPKSWIYVGSYHTEDETTNWYSRFQSAGIELVAGERISLQMRFREITYWPSKFSQVWTEVQAP